MNSIVTDEQCEQIIQSVLKELGFTVRKNLVQHSTWYERNQASVIDVTTMNLSDELVQSKCEMMLNGQKPTLLIGGSKCAEGGQMNEPSKSYAVCVQAVRETAQWRQMLHASASRRFQVMAWGVRQEVFRRRACCESDGGHGVYRKNRRHGWVMRQWSRKCPMSCREVGRFIQGSLWQQSSRVWRASSEQSVGWVRQQLGSNWVDSWRLREHLWQHYRQEVENRGCADRKAGRGGVHGQTRSFERSSSWAELVGDEREAHEN